MTTHNRVIPTQTDDPRVQPPIQPSRKPQSFEGRSVRYFTRQQRRISRLDLRDRDGWIERADRYVSAIDDRVAGLVGVQTGRARISTDLGLSSRAWGLEKRGEISVKHSARLDPDP
jgi:hypothetical protein